MNLVKKSLIEGGTKGGVGISGGVKALIKALLLLALNPQTGPWPVSSSCSPVELARGLTQKLHRAQDFKAIVMEI